jgi:tripartite-type tricarboxylate transporter receptor subunit TctC
MKKFWPIAIALIPFVAPDACTAAQGAAAYPAKPIRMVIPYAAGGGVDIIGRIIAAKLTEELGQSVIVDNRTGAGSTIGTEVVAKAPPDGYTLLVTNNSIAYGPSLYPRLPYDTVRDLAPVSLIGTTANVVVVHPSVPAKNVTELLALMKARPGQLNYGSGGVGGAVHLGFELFQSMAGVKATHIAYKGVGPALIDTIAGQVQIMIAGLPPTLGYIKANRLRALAVTTAKRLPSVPTLPTVAESGVPGYEYITWYPMFVPAATPNAIVTKLNQTTSKTLSSSELREKFAQQGIDPESSSPEQLAALLQQELARWGKIIKAARIQAE